MTSAGVLSRVKVMKRVYMKAQDFKSNERPKVATKRFGKFCHETKWQNFFWYLIAISVFVGVLSANPKFPISERRAITGALCAYYQ